MKHHTAPTRRGAYSRSNSSAQADVCDRCKVRSYFGNMVRRYPRADNPKNSVKLCDDCRFITERMVNQ